MEEKKLEGNRVNARSTSKNHEISSIIEDVEPIK